MSDKYYTPEIEEFHVGFEFESNYITYSKDKEWVKVTLKEDLNNEEIAWFYTSYIGDAVPTEFRVKHLDREDIESLGFDWIKEHCYVLGDWSIITGSETISIYIEGEDDCRFYGKIKNKSELKRVLKMIGV